MLVRMELVIVQLYPSDPVAKLRALAKKIQEGPEYQAGEPLKAGDVVALGKDGKLYAAPRWVAYGLQRLQMARTSEQIRNALERDQ